MPPGGPAPSMKSLDEIYHASKEPTVPLITGSPGVSIAADGGITIDQSGSYHLTDNLSVTTDNGINVNAQGVTLDLRGFAIASTAEIATGAAIDVNAGDVTIFNGRIVSGTTYDRLATGDQFTGSGFEHGIYALSIGTSFGNLRIQGVSVKGCDRYGIYCGTMETAIVRDCTVTTVGSFGIRAGVVTGCSVSECGSTAIRAKTVDQCYAASTNSDGIVAKTVSNSEAATASASTRGIWADCASNCYATAVGGTAGRSGSHL